MLRVILLLILMACMLSQPFCFHCFAGMRALNRCAESEKQNVLEIDTDSFPVADGGVCTKKPCLSTPKIELDHLQKIVCIWHGLLPAEAISPCFTSLDVNILPQNSVFCPVWLRFSALLI